MLIIETRTGRKGKLHELGRWVERELKNMWIEHNAAVGISFSGADDLSIQNVLVTFTGAPASGPNPTADDVNINGYNSQRVHLS